MSFRYCEFGHLLVPVKPAAADLLEELGFDSSTAFIHVFEADALECSQFEAMGWPSGLRRRE